MEQKVNQIREMEIIEKELNEAKVGVLAFSDEKQNIRQVVTPFVYVDKNLFFNENLDENLLLATLGDSTSFSIFREIKLTGKDKSDFIPSLKIIQIKCVGLFKKADELKVIEEVSKTFNKKYNISRKEDKNKTDKFLFIDTEEIQASEIING